MQEPKVIQEYKNMTTERKQRLWEIEKLLTHGNPTSSGLEDIEEKLVEKLDVSRETIQEDLAFLREFHSVC